MNTGEKVYSSVSRALSTAIVSSIGAFAALTLLSIGVHGNVIVSPVVSELWPGLAAIGAVALAVFFMGLQVFANVLRMPEQMRRSLISIQRTGDDAEGRLLASQWESARYRSRVIGGFGTPLGALLLGAGWIGEREHLLWAGGTIAALSVFQLGLSLWVARAIRKWQARAADVMSGYGTLGQSGDTKRYEPFEQLRELLAAGPAKVVTAFVGIGFTGLGVLAVYNLAVLGNQVGYSSAALAGGLDVAQGEGSIIRLMVTIAVIAFGLALVVALIDVVRGLFDPHEAHPLERLAHPLAGIAPACIAVGFAFVLVVPGEMPLGATEAHMIEMRQLIGLGLAGVAMLVLSWLLAAVGAGASRRATR